MLSFGKPGSILILFGVIWLLCSMPFALMMLFSPEEFEEARNALQDQSLGILFTGLGVLNVSVGVGCIIAGVRKKQRYNNLMRNGSLTEGRIVEVGPSMFSINKVRQWQITYEYADHIGKSHRAKSHYLPPAEGGQWNIGDKGRVRFDRGKPDYSVWIGKDMPSSAHRLS